ncbi:MAG: AAA family ATPase [Planctomycetes bacterium]|nr:AAA family ATPase [Planctomycetota bacterium]
MEAIRAAASAFLDDEDALAAARELDEARSRALPELRDALLAFRDADETLARLVQRIEYHLGLLHEPSRGAPRNLWGFRNDDESRFLKRFLDAAPRIPEVDLASLFRSHLADGSDDAERIQVLLAFGEFVAGLDARGDGREQLGIGPATHFLTFAWHCLSKGEEPVFQFSSDQAIRSLARSGALGPRAKDRDWEPRFATFYSVSRAVVDAIPKLPKRMRSGWAVEHVLDYVNAHADRWAELAPAAGAADELGGSGMWQPKGGGGSQPSIVGGKGPAPAIDRPGTKGAAAIERPAPPQQAEKKGGKRTSDRFQQIARAKKKGGSEPSHGAATHASDPPSDGRSRKKKGDIKLPKKTVRIVDSKPLRDTGMSLEDALPPDRTPPGGTVRPPREDVRQWEANREERERESAKTDTGRFKTAAMIQREEREAREAERASRAPARTPRATNYDPTEDDFEPLPFETPRSEPATPSESSRLATAAMLSEFRGEVVQANQGAPAPTEHADRLARDLHLLPALCDDMLAAIRERGRLLLVGPPCTGKTYVARRVAIHVAGHTDRVLFLRAHPGLNYAALIDDRGTPGLVRTFCERARASRELNFVLLVDELDRGDSAAAFGELIGALSERGNPVRLASGEDLSVPRNLQVLATARDYPFDPALMARFPVAPLEADSAVLRRFLAECRPGLEWVARMLDVLNLRLSERGHPLRIGHGFFMDPELDVIRVRRVWQREVLPLLISHGIDTAELGYDALRPRD